MDVLRELHELKMMHIRSFPLAVAALLAAATACPALAQDFVLHRGYSADLADSAKVLQRATVPYSDLDAASARGAQELLRRIEAAADAVCGGAADEARGDQREAYLDCREPAISGAVARMRSPALAALASVRRAELRRQVSPGARKAP